MSKKRWFDRNGLELKEGDKVRDIFSNKEELVYSCHPDGRPDKLNLGLSATSEEFMERHPEWPRDIYPFDNFEHLLIKGQMRLVDYEKVVST